MPTGYTAPVQNGDVTEFKEYAMGCARAFGALITMRDDPIDAEIPEEFIPAPYYQESLNKNIARLEEILGWTYEEYTHQWHLAAVAYEESKQEINTKRLQEHERYELMLHQVNGWTPPSDDHIKFKKFMQDQLTESIKFDCTPYSGDTFTFDEQFPTASKWWQDKYHSVAKSVKYSTESLQKEIDRCADRSKWVNGLRDSLC